MLALEVFLTRVETLGNHTFLGTNLGHGTPALALDEDLSLVALVATNLIAIEIVSAEIPLAIPAVLLHSLDHSVDSLLHALGLLGLTQFLAQGNVILTCYYEQTGNHEALGLGALGYVLGGLEALVWIP